MRITAEIDRSQIGNIEVKLQEISEKAKQALFEGGLLVQTACQEECPVDTGLLRSSISVEQVSETEVTIGPNTNYAASVEFGTAPHEITAKGGGVLAFPGTAMFYAGGQMVEYTSPTKVGGKKGGNMVFVKRVMHPGTPPNPYMMRGIERSRDEVADYIRSKAGE